MILFFKNISDIGLFGNDLLVFDSATFFVHPINDKTPFSQPYLWASKEWLSPYTIFHAFLTRSEVWEMQNDLGLMKSLIYGRYTSYFLFGFLFTISLQRMSI